MYTNFLSHSSLMLCINLRQRTYKSDSDLLESESMVEAVFLLEDSSGFLLGGSF